MTIQDFVAERGIKFLFHFTPIENLDSILRRGLLPKKDCQRQGLASVINDEMRLDQTDAICLTISFPNYKTFYRCRMINVTRAWAVVAINPAVLWQNDCAFCNENAASAAVTCLPIATRKGLAALQGMFADFGDKERATLNLLDEYTTNPQAEVLVFDPIIPELIVGVAFNSPLLKNKFGASYKGFEFVFAPKYFKYRNDYEHWSA